jgi:hypothetical protein
MDDALLWLDSNRGIYLPQAFAQSFLDRASAVSGVSDEDWAILEAGPDHEWYWETWAHVEDNAIVTAAGDGTRYRLYQDGDLWLVPVDEEA